MDDMCALKQDVTGYVRVIATRRDTKRSDLPCTVDRCTNTHTCTYVGVIDLFFRNLRSFLNLSGNIELLHDTPVYILIKLINEGIFKLNRSKCMGMSNEICMIISLPHPQTK